MLLSNTYGAILVATIVPAHALYLPYASQLKSKLTDIFTHGLHLDGSGETYSVDQVAKGPGKTPFEKLQGDYVRWRGELPAHLQKREPEAEPEPATPTVTGTVQATPQPGDAEYYVPVKIGSQTFHVILDSGSSDFWVWSKQIPKADWGNHSIYQETGQKYTNPAITWDISYADGSGASGTVWYDNVTLAGIKTGYAVEAATSLSSRFLSANEDGIIGFAFDSGNTCSPYLCYTFMDLVGSKLAKPIFTSTLRKGKPGTYDFGFIDTKKYNGSIAYTPVDNSSSYWGLTTTGYAVGSGKKVTYSQATIADTGTVLLYVPDDLVNAYYATVKGAVQESDGFIYFPCTSTTPSFSLYIGSSHKATVPGSYLNVGAVNSTTCLGGVQSADIVGSNIIGDVFLKSQFIVYDHATPKIGFAQQPNLPAK